MYESFFSYSLARPYPYRWFTWIVILGGIAATVLFSILNLAANGYESSIEYVTDPNATEHPDRLAWYQKKPWSYATKINPVCQDQLLFLGSLFFSTRLLEWLRELRIVPLQNMSLKIQSNSGILVASGSTNTTCTVYEDSIPVVLSFSHEFNIKDIKDIYVMNSLGYEADPHEQPSLFVGQCIFSFIYYDNFFVSDTSNSFYFNRDGSTASFSTSSGLGFLAMAYEVDINIWSSTLWTDDDSKLDIYVNGSLPPHSSWHSRPIQPYITSSWAMNIFAQTIHSIVLTDLGQNVPSNLFASPEGVFSYWNTLKPYTPPDQGYAHFYQARGMNLPHVDPAVINAKYTCQVPKKKAASSLIISVLIADLVFLQALWTIYNWIVKTVLERQAPDANHCEGCATAMARIEHLEKQRQLIASPPNYHDQTTDLNLQVPASIPLQHIIRERTVAGSAHSSVKDSNESTVGLLSEP